MMIKGKMIILVPGLNLSKIKLMLARSPKRKTQLTSIIQSFPQRACRHFLISKETPVMVSLLASIDPGLHISIYLDSRKTSRDQICLLILMMHLLLLHYVMHLMSVLVINQLPLVLKLVSLRAPDKFLVTHLCRV